MLCIAALQTPLVACRPARRTRMACGGSWAALHGWPTLGGSGGHSIAYCTAAVASSSSRVSNPMRAVNPDAAGLGLPSPCVGYRGAGLPCMHPST